MENQNRNKYNNTYIYKIFSHQTNKIYIGSTNKKSYKCRLYDHRYDYKKNRPYCSSFEILKYNDADIQLLEKCIFNNKNERFNKEREYIDLYSDICVNIYKPKIKN